MSGNGKNGGFMYDCVKLEAGSIVTPVQGISDNSANMEQSCMPKAVKYAKNGRIVIESANKIYSISGAELKVSSINSYR